MITRKLKMSYLFLAVVSTLLILSNTHQKTSADQDSVNSNIPETFNYGAYVEKYHKSHDLVETLSRAKLFIGRTLQIFKHNVSFLVRKVGHFLTQNEFTDMTPDEIKETFSSKSLGLIPVSEAEHSPNLPANLASSVFKLKASEKELFSQSTAHETSAEQQPKRDVDSVAFLAEQNIDLKSVLAELKKDPAAAEKLAMIEDASRKMNKAALVHDNQNVMHPKELEEPSEPIKFKPIVEPDNKQFDPSSMPSRGLMTQSSGWKHFDIDYYMNEMDLNPRFYSNDDGSDQSESDDEGGTIASLISSIKSLHGQFSMKREGEDKSNNQDDDDEVLEVSGDDITDTRHMEPAHPSAKGGQILYNVDWRRSQCISRAKQQAKCNSCYAFASLDLLEFFYCRQMKTRTEFSVQYLMDCGQKVKLNGCQGGKISSVGEFVRKFGVQLNAIYPYQATEQECPFVSDNTDENKWHYLKPTIKAWKLFSDMSAWYKWLPKSPLIVGINMPSDFLAYGGGIHDGQSCDPELVHAMLLVGSGVQDGQSFWLLKNTFSFAWGEGGYFRLAHKAPLRCFNSAVVARVDF